MIKEGSIIISMYVKIPTKFPKKVLLVNINPINENTHPHNTK